MRHALVPVLLSVPRLSHCLGLLALKQRKRSLRTDERCDSMSSLPKESRTANPQNFLGLTFLFLSAVCKIYSISRIYLSFHGYAASRCDIYISSIHHLFPSKPSPRLEFPHMYTESYRRCFELDRNGIKIF